MQPNEPVRGFMLQAFQQQNGRNGREPSILLSGKLENGETFAVVETRQKPVLYVRTGDYGRIQGLQAVKKSTVCETDMLTMDGESVVCIESETGSARAYLRKVLHETGIRTYEADLSPVRRYLMDRKIHCALSVSGTWTPGRRIDRVYTNPDTAPADWNGSLALLSFDIETDIRKGTILAISYTCTRTIPPADRIRGVLLLSDRERELVHKGVPYRFFASEPDLLAAFLSTIRTLDPDIITGWNISDFDLPVLETRCRAASLPFVLGRSENESTFARTDDGQDQPCPVIGRQVLDGLRLSRMALKGMDDYRLETVARTVTGKTKLITGASGEERAEEVIRLHREDILALGEYCLTDAELVLDILEKEKLIDLTIRKSLLIGLPLDQVWKSVVSFEFLYLEELHARKRVAPTRGVDQEPLTASPGGGIITPIPGLHENVLVFDFKSLYPSIMRTFNIDPLSHAAARAGAACEPDCIRAPNGAVFDREPGILPALLDGFTRSREQARSEGNTTASYAYKIIMNSFYGVLGTEGCRFASADLAGSITEFGRTILFHTRDMLAARGYRVLYGDTDSVFLLSGFPPDSPPDQAIRAGETLAAVINAEIADYIETTWRTTSKLEIEFEKYYRKFYLPSIRNLSVDEEVRGRAKGYAGLLVQADGRESLDITGMEAVRHDWTDLAREFQKKLLMMVFHDRAPDSILSFVRDIIRQVYAGELDQALVYRKSLRKPVEAYTKSMPPHVKAAAMLPVEDRQGKVEYFWTVSGPEPVLKRSSPIDYSHYVEKQLKPIAASLLAAFGLSFEFLFIPGGQLELF